MLTRRVLSVFASPLSRRITTSSTNFRDVVDRKEMLRSMPKEDQGTAGEKAVDIDTLISGKIDMFPDKDSINRLFNGVPFKNLPIINVRVSSNNTIFSLIDDKGSVHAIRSCGMEGFKNCRKGTNVAAQATAISFASNIIDKGYKTVRVTVRGLGPGRMSSVKGLQMAGIDIVSITDCTHVSWNPPRARKARKL